MRVRVGSWGEGDMPDQQPQEEFAKGLRLGVAVRLERQSVDSTLHGTS